MSASGLIEVRSYLRELDEEDEFDDVELNKAALAAVSGGGNDGFRSL